MDNKQIILIDTSYTTYYRFFATMRWYSLAYSDEYKINNNSEYDWSTNNAFFDKYKKLYLENIIKLFNKNTYNNSNIIFCMDSSYEDIWRYKLYKEYKNNRSYIEKKYNYKNIFEYTYNILIPQIINDNNNICSIKITELEADDIIGIIAIYLENIDIHIHIVSGDSDFLQLGRKNISFLNYKSKLPIIITKEEAYDYLNKKIIYGDKSDNIKGIFKSGYKIKKKDLLNTDILNKYLDINQEAKEQYNLNKKIIDFHYIPKKYINIVINKFKKKINI